jgi:hypothetical protein
VTDFRDDGPKEVTGEGEDGVVGVDPKKTTTG